ncbi:hypothetical protein ACFLYA_02390 [Candidatus Dependentiae bacterium]
MSDIFLGEKSFFKPITKDGIYKLLIPYKPSTKALREFFDREMDLNTSVYQTEEDIPDKDPRDYFGKDKLPLPFTLDPSGHVISGRLEWIPGTNTKVIFFSDSWEPTTPVIDKYTNLFKNTVDALTLEVSENEEFLANLIKLKELEHRYNV